MASNSLVSILIPNYNKASYINECLDSVLAQSYENWECIVIDDHSTDESWKIIEDFSKKDLRFKVYFRPEHLPKGGNVCRNYALDKAKGNFILFLDSDDVLSTYCISQRVKHIHENPDLDFWAFPTALFEKKVSDAQFLWNIDNSYESDLSRFLRMDSLWQTSGAIYSREFLICLDGLTDSRRFWQDYELHLKAIIKTKFYQKYFHLQPDVFIRNGDHSSLSRSTPFSGDLNILIERIEFLEEIELFAGSETKGLSNRESHSLFSFKFYLIIQLWIKHGKYAMFKKRWLQYSTQYGLSKTYQMKGFVYAFIYKINNRLKMKLIDKKINQLNFPDYRILDQVQIGKNTIKR